MVAQGAGAAAELADLCRVGGGSRGAVFPGTEVSGYHPSLLCRDWGSAVYSAAAADQSSLAVFFLAAFLVDGGADSVADDSGVCCSDSDLSRIGVVAVSGRAAMLCDGNVELTLDLH